MKNSKKSLNPSLLLGLRTAVLLGLLMPLCGVAQARDYLIEVIVFENMKAAKTASRDTLYFPRVHDAIGLSSGSAEKLNFTLKDDSLSLGETASKIKASGQYRLLKHFAWQQPGLAREDAKAIRVNIGSPTKMYIPEDTSAFNEFIPATAQLDSRHTREITSTTVNGSLKVSLGRFLHLDAVLVFTDPENGRSYRLSQSRKMRSREFHYIDNARFGLLVKILPVEEDGSITPG